MLKFLPRTIVFYFLLALSASVLAIGETDEAPILNEEGGPVRVTGTVSYTSPFFTDGVAAPLVILEDQAGFVDRNFDYLISPASQVLGKITSNFFESPFSYSLDLPATPNGDLRDVDNDNSDDVGVMIFAVAYWNNVFGDPYLEERDLFGGGWSTAYASTRTSPNLDTLGEYLGGTLIVYAPQAGQGFPSAFGPDGRLFTGDEPIVRLPQGYTVVNMDSEPFTFDRSREPVIDLIEGEGAAIDDYSDLPYDEAFLSLWEQMRLEYAYSDLKNVDWEALRDEFLPRFEAAAADGDQRAYERAMMEWAWAIDDAHHGGTAFDNQAFQEATAGGLGIAIRQLDDGRVIVSFNLDGAPAAQAGIELGAEIIALDGVPIDEAIDNTLAWSQPFSTDHVRRLQQERYVTRFPLGTTVAVTYRNPDAASEATVSLEVVGERESFSFSSFNVGLTGFEKPIEFELLEESGFGYVKIFTFSDNDLLQVQLWERLMVDLNANNVPGLVIDLRQNGGGSSFLLTQMAAYFFDEPLAPFQFESYREERGGFVSDERFAAQMYLPPEPFRYNGEIAVLVGPNCNSACEIFAWTLSNNERAEIVGQYPTGGLVGGQKRVLLPENNTFQFSSARTVNPAGEIIIEGVGVVPTVDVPVNEETLFSDGDPVLEAAIDYLAGATALEIVEGGAVTYNEAVTGTLAPRTRVEYAFSTGAGAVVNMTVSDESGELDTVLRIFDTAGNELLANDDLPGTVNSGFTGLELPPGLDLVLQVGGFGDEVAGDFTLEIVPVQADPEAE